MECDERECPLRESRDVLSNPEYDRLSLVAVETRFGQIPGLDSPSKVTVVVRRPADTEFSNLPTSLHRRLANRMDGPITVEVEFRDTLTTRTGKVAPPTARHYEMS